MDAPTPQHSLFAPSSAHRWVECPASIMLGVQFPELDPDSEASRQGAAAHWVAYQMRYARAPEEGSLAPNGETVTDEMLTAALLYMNDVFFVMNQTEGISHVKFEQRIPLAMIHPEAFGTPDAAVVRAHAGEAIVWDFKFGHDPVEAFENWQCVAYAWGLVAPLQLDGHAEQHFRVRIRIVQPRCYRASGPVQEWSTTVAELRGMFNRLRDAAEEAVGPSPACKVGPHCKHCPARRGCGVLQKAAYQAADAASRPMPVQLPPAALGLELFFLQRAQQALNARVDALQQQAEFAIRGGQAVPGWGMEASSGREKWQPDSVSTVISLGQLMGVELAKPTAPVTPNQARELFKKAGIDPAVIAGYSERIPGAQKLVPVNSSKVARAFQ